MKQTTNNLLAAILGFTEFQAILTYQRGGLVTYATFPFMITAIHELQRVVHGQLQKFLSLFCKNISPLYSFFPSSDNGFSAFSLFSNTFDLLPCVLAKIRTKIINTNNTA